VSGSARVPLRRYVRLLARYLRPQAYLVALLAVVLLVGVGFRLAVPLLAAGFVDLVVGGGARLGDLLLLGAAVCVAGVLDQVCTVTGSHLGAYVSWMATNRLREEVTGHVLAQDVSYHDRHGAGELIERIDGDARELTNFFATFAVKLSVNLAVVVGVVVVMTVVDWRIGLGYLGFCLLAMYVFDRVRGLASPHWRRLREADTELYGDVMEWFEGLPDIRANGGDGYVRRRFAAGVRTVFHRTRSATNVSLGISHGSAMILALGSTGVLALAAVLYRAGTLDIGIVVALLLYTRIISAPLEDIVKEIADLQRATASMDRLEGLLALTPAVVSGPGAELPDGPVGVSFENVTFTYPDTVVPALREVSFALRPGEVLGLVGRTGSGKTTMTRLLLRFYDPAAGRISLGGHDLRGLTLGQVRGRVGIVNQDVHLFAATVRDNLTLYADPAAGESREDELVALLREVGLGGWYDRLDRGLDTVLAAGGGGMSAGEAQLLSVARIFVADPGVVVLDEPTSRLDPASEAAVQRAFDRLLEGRTAVVIAHRLRTLERVDTILVLRDGAIAEYGPRVELAADPGSAYHRALAVADDEPLAGAVERSPAW
jgi:ATP-binding cassette, subfamily B, bacterial